MASFCLPKDLSSKFLARLKSGTIDPQRLSDMSSKERHAFFEKMIGEENAKHVNALFESKLLLKNQQQGIINWAKKVGGLKPEAMKDIISKVNKMTEILNPENEAAFLEDLVSHKLGTTVTMEEAGKISELAKKVSEKKEEMEKGGDRLKYGKARVEFGNYINSLKEEAGNKTLMDRIKNPMDTLVDAAGASKSIKASFDNSAIFRQGWKAMWTHPDVWLKNSKKSFADIWNTFGGKAVMDELNADIVSRPNYDLMKKAKLAVGTIEEAYPSHLNQIKKIPLVGKAYKASETAFTAFLHKTRADIFDKYVDIAKSNGVDLTEKTQVESLGKLVNSLTGRGNLGGFERSANAFNNIFFSPRFLKSHIDVLTAHQFQKGVTPFVRKQAAINLLKIIGGTAAVLATANAVAPGSVEKDPRSSDFGKIRVGNTRFDVSGGMSSLATLAMRLLTMSSKSSISGKVKKLNSGEFGSQTGADVFYNFLENKLSPAASVLKDIMKGRDFQGNKPTVLGEAKNLFVPLPITNYQELKNDPESANILATMIADALGIGTNTYSGKKKKKPNGQ